MWGNGYLNNLIVMVISQCICISKHHLVHLEYVPFYFQFYLDKGRGRGIFWFFSTCANPLLKQQPKYRMAHMLFCFCCYININTNHLFMHLYYFQKVDIYIAHKSMKLLSSQIHFCILFPGLTTDIQNKRDGTSNVFSTFCEQC